MRVRHGLLFELAEDEPRTPTDVLPMPFVCKFRFDDARHAAQQFWTDDSAATAVEYGVIITFIAAAMVTALSTMGVGIKGIFLNIVGIFASRSA